MNSKRSERSHYAPHVDPFGGGRQSFLFGSSDHRLAVWSVQYQSDARLSGVLDTLRLRLKFDETLLNWHYIYHADIKENRNQFCLRGEMYRAKYGSFQRAAQ